MKNCFLLAANIFLCFSLNAQQTGNPHLGVIRGSVLDSATAQPLEYATVSLFRSDMRKPVNGAATLNSGKFLLEKVPVGSYKLVIEFIGFKAATIRNIKISDSAMSLDLRPVYLARISSRLPSVLIYSPPSILDNHIDKSVFNAQQDITSQGGVATDILQKIPLVSVDADGTIELAGSANIRFLIDGKPSSIFGSNISDVLESIPASEIKNVEVITNPGAKYNAEGMGGIINIILKKDDHHGINGDMSLTGGSKVENGSFNLNIRKKNFGVTAFLSGYDRLVASYPDRYERVSLNATRDTTTTLIQDGSNKAKRSSLLTGIGFDWSPGSKSFFSGSVHYNDYRRSSYGTIAQSQAMNLNDGSGTLISLINTINNPNYGSRFHTTDFNLYYKGTLGKPGKTLEISANTSIERSHDYSGDTQLFLPGDSIFFGINNRNPGKEQESQFKVDYNDPFSEEGALALGAEVDMDDINTSSSVSGYNVNQKSFLYDSSLMNNLDFHQRVYAAYAQVSFGLARHLEAQLGSRIERTTRHALYSDNLGTNLFNYNTLFPSALLLEKLPANQSLRLSYTRRIQRPDYDDLNPFINISDPKNVTSGNPLLSPETGDLYEFAYSKDWGKSGSMVATLFYRVNHHSIQNYVLYYPSILIGDSTYTDVTLSSRENIGLERNLGLNIFEGLNLSGKLNLRLNSSFFYRQSINTIDSGHTLNSFNYRINLNTTFKIANNLAAEFFGNFNSLRHEAQGTYPAYFIYNFGIRKLFWKNRGSLALTATNPFNEYINRNLSLSGPGFKVTNRQQLPFRSFGINFTWKFGHLDFKNSPETESVNPDQEPND